MQNVYDIIAEFYEHDENWNMLLRREYAEGFVRKEAWKGAEDAMLQSRWQQLMMLCLYLGYAETFLGDMTEYDFIDAVAWCSRNVSDFKLERESVSFFLDTCASLFVYLKAKKAITSASAPRLAAEKLLGAEDFLRLLNEKDELWPQKANLKRLATPNAPVKIFLNIGNILQSLLDELHQYYQKKEFNPDLDRALYLYQGIFPEGETEEEPETDEFWQCFWDYFLLDYHLLRYDDTPLAHFAKHGASKHPELIEELLKAKLAVFSVDGLTEDNYFICTDFLTGEQYVLNLPIEEALDTKDMLFVGHCFYGNTMVMNYIRGLKIGKLARKRLRDIFACCHDWFRIQEPGADKKAFIARHPMLIRHLVFVYSTYVKPQGFGRQTAVKDYEPSSGKITDEVASQIQKRMREGNFSQHDILLAIRLWQDFCRKGRLDAVDSVLLWAEAVIDTYVMLNGMTFLRVKESTSSFRNSPTQASVEAVAGKIRESLLIESNDPRYCSEEGFLIMMFSS